MLFLLTPKISTELKRKKLPLTYWNGLPMPLPSTVKGWPFIQPSRWASVIISLAILLCWI